MSVQFLTTLSPEQFKQFLKEVLIELLPEKVISKQTSPEILDLKQAADFLKLKVNTLYEKTSRKQVPHFKKGNKLYFHLSELENWIRQGKVKTKQEIEGEAVTYALKQAA